MGCWSRGRALVGMLGFVTACGRSAPLVDAAPDAPANIEPVTCAQMGGIGNGTLVDEAGVMHRFGPGVSVTYEWRQSDVPQSIVLDDGTTKITVYGVACSFTSTTCPVVGEWTVIDQTHSFQSSWFTGSVRPDAMDVIVDVAKPGDACWGGRYDITYGFDFGGVMGELRGWWADP